MMNNKCSVHRFFSQTHFSLIFHFARSVANLVNLKLVLMSQLREIGSHYLFEVFFSFSFHNSNHRKSGAFFSFFEIKFRASIILDDNKKETVIFWGDSMMITPSKKYIGSTECQTMFVITLTIDNDFRFVPD